MIVCKLSELPIQAAPRPGLLKAVAFLEGLQGKALEDGRVAIDEDRVYALVQSYQSRDNPEIVFEGHRRYIDIQCVLAGQEVLGWAPMEAATVTREYSSERDMWLGTVPKEFMTPVLLTAGHVAVLFPTDAHAPGRAAGAPSPVKKIVVKVAIL